MSVSVSSWSERSKRSNKWGIVIRSKYMEVPPLPTRGMKRTLPTTKSFDHCMGSMKIISYLVPNTRHETATKVTLMCYEWSYVSFNINPSIFG